MRRDGRGWGRGVIEAQILSLHTCAFEGEQAPCVATPRRLLGLAADTDDRTATAAVWDYHRKESDKDRQPFLKLVSIAAVVRRRDERTGIDLTL